MPELREVGLAGIPRVGVRCRIVRLALLNWAATGGGWIVEAQHDHAILKEKDPRTIGVRDLRDWIQREIHLSLANAPFDVSDTGLILAAGRCSTYPKRSGANPLLFADSIPQKDVCTDRECSVLQPTLFRVLI
jgi:hypothetical protein